MTAPALLSLLPRPPASCHRCYAPSSTRRRRPTPIRTVSISIPDGLGERSASGFPEPMLFIKPLRVQRRFDPDDVVTFREGLPERETAQRAACTSVGCPSRDEQPADASGPALGEAQDVLARHRHPDPAAAQMFDILPSLSPLEPAFDLRVGVGGRALALHGIHVDRNRFSASCAAPGRIATEPATSIVGRLAQRLPWRLSIARFSRMAAMMIRPVIVIW